MGCDIHAHVEVKLDGAWHHLVEADLDRNYTLFGYMAGVRGYDIVPLCNPRGLPEDVSVLTAVFSRRLGVDGHSHSWLNYDEMLKVQEFAEENNISLSPWWFRECRDLPFGAYLFGNDLMGWRKYPDDYPSELQDIRLVFWFDN